ncbi:hypothetical protein P8C59_001036 [Phyllachora maydis]|uniref:tripeptidyl-peptidase II n=1 Tax=Phyllachora maydis TaxID=1825666 RepID=A0AAD9HYS0_9PEZI|nr:hypothetical protein P8C59_001036 [Phyllachora maydis]
MANFKGTFAALAGLARAGYYAVKETHHVPRGWRRLGRASPHHLIRLQIGLAQSNWDELERHLIEVSDPDHDRYGQHLSAGDVGELVRPTQETSDLVHAWLAAEGVASSALAHSAAGDWITVSLPVRTVEHLLDTEYHTYEHGDGARVVRAPTWSLPRHLHAHINTVQPTTSFLRARPTSIRAVCNISSVTPACFETLYHTQGYKTQASGAGECGGNRVGFTNYLGQHPIPSDLRLFLQKYRPEALASVNFTNECIANAVCTDKLSPADLADGTSAEANLDVQAIAGMSWSTPIKSYSTGGSPPWIAPNNQSTITNEPYLEWVNYVLNQSEIPQVISTSYADDESTVPPSYANRVCRQFAQIGARGTTLLFASGDDGVGPSGTTCSRFVALFPSSCPWVTSVGATMDFAPEMVAYRPAFVDANGARHGNYTSGGGFSNYFATPAYQAEAVAKYVAGLDGRYDGLYNKSGRGYPDISAQGLYFAYFYNGKEGTISGTSASTPLTSAILSLVNDALMAAGKSPLGFMNPWLYKVGHKGLNDIVNGSAHGCGVDGFPAVAGWDAVTGLGTPNFPRLVELAGAYYVISLEASRDANKMFLCLGI